MSSNTPAMLESLILNNYFTLSLVVVVGYDYVLTFSREIDYVWRRKWTWVSTMFVVVRYSGLCWAMVSGLLGSIFVPGPVTPDRCNVLFLVSCWAFPVFYCTADLVMVLRVYTMWGRSKAILYVLLFVYVVQVVVSVVFPAIYNSSPTYFTASTTQIYDFTVCSGSFSPSMPALLDMYTALPRFLLSVMLLVLAVIRTLKQLVAMYRATKLWQPSRYMSQFTRDGILYFFMNMSYNIIATVTWSPTISSQQLVGGVLGLLTYPLMACMMPRFIIEVREMYDRDLHGFGVFSRGTSTEKGTASSIAFADPAKEESQTTVQSDAGELGAIRLGQVDEGAQQV